ncbi:hypothetical protein FGO68_gene10820 [Halteria grandinella]|uniref:Uncharacterized protein n=1 Tax=Halteria grandinella TaxID=5974 RepID=A0A8J8P2B2_HALGN|nr:hypothetical protein FGO68_gene10820 [Halteria grandinella]
MGRNSCIIVLTPPTTTVIQYSQPSYSIMGLLPNSAQNRIHMFSFTSTACVITAMDATSFANLYQYQVQSTFTDFALFAQTFQSCNYETLSDEDTVVYQEGTRFFRVHYKYSTSTSTRSTMHDPASPSLKARGLLCLSSDIQYSLMSGTYLTDTNRIFVAEVNFNTQKITYRRYLQGVGTSIYHGIIFESNKFFIAGFSTTVYKTTSSYFTSRTPSKVQGLIFSPMKTCQSLDEFSYPVVTLTPNAFTFTATSLTFGQSSLSVQDYSSILAAPLIIASTQFVDQYITGCGLQFAQAPHDYAALQSTQAITTYSYFYCVLSTTFSITPFTATKVSPSAADPVFTYSVKSFNGPYNGVTITAATGEITIPSPSALGPSSYIVEIEGKLQDCQKISASITVTGDANTAP